MSSTGLELIHTTAPTATTGVDRWTATGVDVGRSTATGATRDNHWSRLIDTTATGVHRQPLEPQERREDRYDRYDRYWRLEPLLERQPLERQPLEPRTTDTGAMNDRYWSHERQRLKEVLAVIIFEVVVAPS